MLTQHAQNTSAHQLRINFIDSLETISERRERLFKKFMDNEYAKERKRVWYFKTQ